MRLKGHISEREVGLGRTQSVQPGAQKEDCKSARERKARAPTASASGKFFVTDRDYRLLNQASPRYPLNATARLHPSAVEQSIKQGTLTGSKPRGISDHQLGLDLYSFP